ncbi:MAG: ferredoxin reductase [Frankiales bacterium]|nr:ferredoxin reductase [Frankiales bacterium]
MTPTRAPWKQALRAAATRMSSPLLPDDYLHLINPLWSARELRGKVVEVRKETDHAATLVIKPGWGWSGSYEAGQYIGIGTQVDGRWHWRSYSLTSTPVRNDGLIAITVKAMPEGFLSGHLVNGLAPGTIVRLQAPQGNFVLPSPPPARILFLTAGSGITPIISMLRTLDSRGELPDIDLVHSAPTSADVLFRTELHELADRHPTLRVHEQLTDAMGMLDLTNLDAQCPDWAERQTWACGPPAMLDAAEQVWGDRGISERLHLERFSIALAGAGGEGGTVTFAKSGKAITVDGATTLLLAGEQAGVQMPFGCRMGICQSCVLPLTGGSVRDLRNGTEHTEGGRVQTCISAAAGDCVLDV